MKEAKTHKGYNSSRNHTQPYFVSVSCIYWMNSIKIGHKLPGRDIV